MSKPACIAPAFWENRVLATCILVLRSANVCLHYIFEVSFVNDVEILFENAIGISDTKAIICIVFGQVFFGSWRDGLELQCSDF